MNEQVTPIITGPRNGEQADCQNSHFSTFLYQSRPKLFRPLIPSSRAASTADPHDGGAGGGRREAWGGRTVARWTLDANHVSFVPESGWPLRSHGPKPRGGHGGRHTGVDGSLNSGFLYFSLPHARSRPVKSWSCTTPPPRVPVHDTGRGEFCHRLPLHPPTSGPRPSAGPREFMGKLVRAVVS